jgi:hypothetical protein
MSLNPYAVLCAFVSLLEGALGIALAVAAVREIARRRRRPELLGDRAPLFAGAGAVVLGLGLASWPLFYLLLDSSVTLWPGVMCMQGVARVGTGSEGPAGRLPALVAILQATKPALALVAGAWLVLHLADRRTRTSPLAGRALATLAALGALATVDAGAEASYVLIRKQEPSLAAGCCTPTSAFVADAGPGVALPMSTTGVASGSPPPVAIAHFALAAALLAGIAAWRHVTVSRGHARGLRRARAREGDAPGGARPPWVSLVVIAGALASIPVGVEFLSRVAAPALLHRPEHECAYCAVSEAPETLVGIGLFLLGALAVAWAGVSGWLARHPETDEARPAQVVRLLTTGLFGYTAAAAFAAAAWAVA